MREVFGPGSLGRRPLVHLTELSGSLLNLVVAGAAAAVVLQFIHPVAYQAPAFRATAETAMTLFALASAWFLRARFRYSRRLDDLLLLGAVLTLALTYLYSCVLPAALDLRSGYGFASAGLWGSLFAAAMFAAAAISPADKLLDDNRRGVARDRDGEHSPAWRFRRSWPRSSPAL